MAARRELIDTMQVRLVLDEAADSKGVVRVRGEFAKSDVPTLNKRVYRRQLWEREIKRLGPALAKRAVRGELDHPADGQTSLKRVSHLVTALSMRSDGVVIGEAEALDTREGQDLQAMLRAGVTLSVSSRGFGSTQTDEAGNEVVQNDFELKTFDFVDNPADVDANPEVVPESATSKQSSSTGLAGAPMEENMPGAKDRIEVSREEIDALVSKQVQEQVKDQIETALKRQAEEFATRLQKIVESAKSEARAEVRTELLSDPAVGGAQAVLESLKGVLRPYVLPEDAQKEIKSRDDQIGVLTQKLSESSLEVASLTSSVAELHQNLLENTYQLFVEKKLTGDSDAESIRKELGAVTRFESIEDLEKALDESVSAVRERKAARARVEEQRKAEVERMLSEERAKLNAKIEEISQRAKQEEEQRKALQAQLAEATKATSDALDTAEKLSLQVFVERAIATHPNGAALRTYIEEHEPTSQDEVTSLLEAFPIIPERVLQESNEERSARLRKSLKAEGAPPVAPRGRSDHNSDSLEEHVPSKKSPEIVEGTGVTMDAICKLANVG